MQLNRLYMRSSNFLKLCIATVITTGLVACASSTQRHQLSENQQIAQVVSTQTDAEITTSTQDNQTMMQHLANLQKIAEQYQGNRAVGTKGGQASAQYILNEVKKLGLTAQMIPFENREKTVGHNIIVEIEGQSKDTAIILGGHFDSVKGSPGINDNGSGVAVLLELLKHYHSQSTLPAHTIYIAFWDSEEVGVAGSSSFVEQMNEQQLKGIKAYINVDMVGTKQPNVMIADADYSSIDALEAMLAKQGTPAADYELITQSLRQIPTHEGSLALENRLRNFFNAREIVIKEDVSTLASSDTLPFLGKVPVASLIFFNEQLKGNILEFAPCYHQSCDDLNHIDATSLHLAYDAVIDLVEFLEQ